MTQKEFKKFLKPYTINISKGISSGWDKVGWMITIHRTLYWENGLPKSEAFDVYDSRTRKKAYFKTKAGATKGLNNMYRANSPYKLKKLKI